ncbi:ribose-phosphate diphosphokinase [Staphylothermus hellenicus]|uniref:Ribose-phosphate pyrophosphokinase n=1 Tax=Staphylothermus hellenicus (strain DSM 12710 / JCM 10830 / BK20S6-10-b1 / P8) TaxID=591019 RepID=D7D970_STAHD|nr:ribose-phosphate diphosphokinase [Staphylothermus hellenicus]ADI32316.1 ribose-phosphate pyrophosphokinase [Staphylothermus hellenicus DSM 12710]
MVSAVGVVITGKNYESFAEKYASLLGYDIGEIQTKIFPDGEYYVRIKKPELIHGNKVAIINTMYPRQNDSLLETLMLIDAARKAGAKHVVVIIPYLAYARQDKVFLEGEPVTASIVVKMIRMVGADALVVVDIHSVKTLEDFNGKALNVLVSDKLVEKALNILNNPVVIAPDKGALHRAKYAAEKHGLEYDYLVKRRDRITGEISIMPKELRIDGRDIVIIDDIISTGGTIASAARILQSQGARKIIVAATHGLFIGNALEKIRSAGIEKIYTANTLGITHRDPLIETIDVSEKVVSEIRHNNII